jgi:uncharacterized protein YbgA (DUF1722 family)/uncharacterized protein YbbK (DUF523 family)
MATSINLGISSCLLGQKFRYDGEHKLDPFLTYTVGQHVKYVPVCPEVECGFGIPREALRLTGDPESPRLITKITHKDFTERMVRWAKKRIIELEKADLWGFIFKSKSPNCGMEKVTVYNERGMPVKKGSGIFARIFMEHFPLIPVEDEGHLYDPKLRENFIERIFIQKRWSEVLAKKWRIENIMGFHTEHELLILSHSEKHFRSMGKIVVIGNELPIKELYGKYEAQLMEALKLKTTMRKNTHVLQHLMGDFKSQLSADERQALVEVIHQYREGYVPLIVPITLINHYAGEYKTPYLSKQTYFQPHP